MERICRYNAWDISPCLASRGSHPFPRSSWGTPKRNRLVEWSTRVCPWGHQRCNQISVTHSVRGRQVFVSRQITLLKRIRFFKDFKVLTKQSFMKAMASPAMILWLGPSQLDRSRNFPHTLGMNLLHASITIASMSTIVTKDGGFCSAKSSWISAPSPPPKIRTSLP